jgi:hypothetical protein
MIGLGTSKRAEIFYETGPHADATRIVSAFFEIALSEQYVTDVAPGAPRDALNGTTYRTLGSCTAPA